MKDEKLIRGIMKAAKSRDAWDAKSKTYFLTAKEWKSVEGLEFPMKLGKSEATLQPDTQTMKVILKNYAKGKSEPKYVTKANADPKIAAAMDFHKIDISICKDEKWYYEREGRFYKLLTKGTEERWNALPEEAKGAQPEKPELPEETQPEKPELPEETQPEKPELPEEAKKAQPEKPEHAETTPPDSSADDTSKDFLIWVGMYAYPTIKSFVDEVSEKGIARRMKPGIKGFIQGESRLFFAHDEGVKGEGVVIGYCTPKLVKGSLDAPVQKRLSGLIMDDPGSTYAVGEFIETKLLSLNGQIRTKRMIRLDGDSLLKADVKDKLPNQLRVTNIEVKSGEPSSRWTKEEREALVKCVMDSEGINAAFRNFSAATGRSVRSVEYQWYGPIKKLKMS